MDEFENGNIILGCAGQGNTRQNKMNIWVWKEEDGKMIQTPLYSPKVELLNIIDHDSQGLDF